MVLPKLGRTDMSAPSTAITQANSLNPAQPIGSYWTDSSRSCVLRQHLDKPQSPLEAGVRLGPAASVHPTRQCKVGRSSQLGSPVDRTPDGVNWFTWFALPSFGDFVAESDSYTTAVVRDRGVVGAGQGAA